MDPNTVTSYRELLDLYQRRYDAAVASGEVSPFVYPYETLGSLLLILFIFIPQRRYPFIRYFKIPIFLCILAFEVDTIRRCRSMSVAIGYGIGLLAAWGVEWSSVLLLFTDPQDEFQRMERPNWHVKSAPQGTDRPARGVGSSTSAVEHSNGILRRREGKADRNGSVPGDDRKGEVDPSKGDTFYWQSFPVDSLRQRMRWTVDLISNFRGIGWNYQIHGLPGAPKDVQEQLDGTSKDALTEGRQIARGSTGNYRYLDRRTLLRRKGLTLAIGYITLDVCKVVMMRDRYFWGILDAAPPEYYPRLLHESPALLKYFRLIISLVGVYAALQSIFVLAPLFFVGIVGTKRIGARAEPWMYPDMYGEFKTVLDKGLAGWWGGWWHQIFRYAFAAPSKWILERFGMNPKSLPAKTLQLFIAFTMSGLLHACGSYTQLPRTRPSGPFLFFFLQAVGITAQSLITGYLKRLRVTESLPRSVRRAGNLIYVFSWLFLTSPLLVNDFARGGIWLFEPIPVSPLRGLGFGLKGEGWWCWKGPWVQWHRGQHWWDSGIAI